MDLQIEGKTALVTGASSASAAASRWRWRARACGWPGGAPRRAARGAGRRDRRGGRRQPVLIVEDLMQEGAPRTDRRRRPWRDWARSTSSSTTPAAAAASRLDATEAQWHEAMTLNFTRQRQLAHALLDQMIARKWGRIINITGKSEPEGINGAFCAKAAMHAWAKGLSREVGKHGITVNCIPPGRIHPSRSCATTRPSTANGSPSTRSPSAATASPRTWPIWCASWPPRWPATSPAPSSPWMAACGATSSDEVRPSAP